MSFSKRLSDIVKEKPNWPTLVEESKFKDFRNLAHISDPVERLNFSKNANKQSITAILTGSLLNGVLVNILTFANDEDMKNDSIKTKWSMISFSYINNVLFSEVSSMDTELHNKLDVRGTIIIADDVERCCKMIFKFMGTVGNTMISTDSLGIDLCLSYDKNTPRGVMGINSIKSKKSHTDEYSSPCEVNYKILCDLLRSSVLPIEIYRNDTEDVSPSNFHEKLYRINSGICKSMTHSFNENFVCPIYIQQKMMNIIAAMSIDTIVEITNLDLTLEKNLNLLNDIIRLFKYLMVNCVMKSIRYWIGDSNERSNMNSIILTNDPSKAYKSVGDFIIQRSRMRYNGRYASKIPIYEVQLTYANVYRLSSMEIVSKPKLAIV